MQNKLRILNAHCIKVTIIFCVRIKRRFDESITRYHPMKNSYDNDNDTIMTSSLKFLHLISARQRMLLLIWTYS